MELDVVHNSQDFSLERKHRMKGTKRDGEGRNKNVIKRGEMWSLTIGENPIIYTAYKSNTDMDSIHLS